MSYSPVRILPLVVTILFGAGCANTPATPEVTAPPTSPVTETDNTPRGVCDNPYYPIRLGYVATYAFSGHNVTPMTYTVTAAEGERGAIFLQYEFGGKTEMKMTQQLECSDGSIRALGYLDFGSALSGQNIKSETKKVSGELLPSRMAVGTEWDSAFTIETEINIPGAARLGMSKATGDITSHRKVVSEERVTVPAGTYTALVVEATTVNEMTFGNIKTPTTVTSTEYWVKGVGLVKTVMGNTVMEAQSFAN